MQKRFVKSLSRSLDPKGRLMLPPEYREAICDEKGRGAFWLTALPYRGNLVAYMPDEWEAKYEKLWSIRNPSTALADFITKFTGLAQEMEPDAQGRVRIPQTLMREAGLSKDVMLVGCASKFEIWDQQRFDRLATSADVSGELGGYGISV